MVDKHLRIVLIGPSRDPAKEVAVAGQSTACYGLLSSQLSDYVDWIIVDTTIESLTPPLLHRRFFSAAKRMATYLGIILKGKLDGVLIFTSWGYSLLEKGIMVFIARLFGKRVIFNPRSGLILNDFEKSRFMRWFIPSVLCQCNIVMCQSQSWKQFYQSISGLPHDRFAVIPNWIDLEPFSHIPTQRQKGDDRVSILFLGRIERNKGIFVLAEAIQMFYEDFQNCRFIICGMGSELGAFKEKIADLALSHLFEFRGWVTGSKKIKALQDADIFVIPSYREGLPNSLLEAMASELAIVASATGGILDVLDDSMGILIQPGDAEALGRAIVELSKNAELRGQFGQRARSYVLENHDINKIWPRLLNMLQVNREK